MPVLTDPLYLSQKSILPPASKRATGLEIVSFVFSTCMDHIQADISGMYTWRILAVFAFIKYQAADRRHGEPTIPAIVATSAPGDVTAIISQLVTAVVRQLQCLLDAAASLWLTTLYVPWSVGSSLVPNRSWRTFTTLTVPR